jgi:hypothetical protein
MSFVAEPYEQFADDLLTSLTGGIVREEHRFTGADPAYSLTTPGAIPASLKVFGMRAEQFRVFEMGIDYDYKSDEEAVRWKSGAAQPDDGSYFYVNYYPRDARRRLTDRNPGSVVSILSLAFGRVMAVVSKQIELVYRSAFLDLAEGSSVDHIAALLGLERKDARFSRGEVLFKRSSPAPADIAIPSGTLVSTDRGVTFETSEKRTLRRGQLAVSAPVRALDQGAPGRVDVGAISLVNRPIFGIEAVTNEAATVFAAGKESDDEFRRRIRSTLDRSGKASLDAIKYTLIEDIPEITEANIQVVESGGDLPGQVEVRLGLDATGAVDLVQRVETSILASRPAGIRVTHNLPTRTAGADADAAQSGISRSEAVADFRTAGEPPGLIHLPQDLLAAMPDGSLDLRVEVLIRLTEPNLTTGQKEQIEDDIRTAVMRHIEALPMGAPLIHNKLLGEIVAPESIADAVLLIGPKADGAFGGLLGNLSTDGRKARTDLYQVYVGLMDEQVFIDLKVVFDGESPPAGIEPQLRAAIATVLAQAGARVVLADLRAAIATEAGRAGAQLAEGDAVILGAQFEETGRLLAAASEITLAEHETPVLRNLALDAKGLLHA